MKAGFFFAGRLGPQASPQQKEFFFAIDGFVLLPLNRPKLPVACLRTAGSGESIRFLRRLEAARPSSWRFPSARMSSAVWDL